MAMRVTAYCIPLNSVLMRIARSEAETAEPIDTPHLFMQRISTSAGGITAPDIYFDSIGWLFEIDLAKACCDKPDNFQAVRIMSAGDEQSAINT